MLKNHLKNYAFVAHLELSSKPWKTFSEHVDIFRAAPVEDIICQRHLELEHLLSMITDHRSDMAFQDILYTLCDGYKPATTQPVVRRIWIASDSSKPSRYECRALWLDSPDPFLKWHDDGTAFISLQARAISKANTPFWAGMPLRKLRIISNVCGCGTFVFFKPLVTPPFIRLQVRKSPSFGSIRTHSWAIPIHHKFSVMEPA